MTRDPQANREVREQQALEDRLEREAHAVFVDHKVDEDQGVSEVRRALKAQPVRPVQRSVLPRAARSRR